MAATATGSTRWSSDTGPGTSRQGKILWWVMLVSDVSIAVYATRYFLLPTRDGHFSRYTVPLRLHIAGGVEWMIWRQAGPGASRTV